MPRKPEITNTKVIAKTKLFNIEAVSLSFSNGEQRVYERIAGNGRSAVFVIPLLDNKTILLAREYAVGTEDYQLGLCKGLIDEGETVLQAANRELQEELGYAAKTLQVLFGMHTSPGYLRSQFIVVLASDLYPCKLAGDEPEPLELVTCSIDSLPSLYESNEMNDARVIASLMRFHAWYQQQNEE